jgi:hypothetical protein
LNPTLSLHFSHQDLQQGIQVQTAAHIGLIQTLPSDVGFETLQPHALGNDPIL